MQLRSDIELFERGSWCHWVGSHARSCETLNPKPQVVFGGFSVGQEGGASFLLR